MHICRHHMCGNVGEAHIGLLTALQRHFKLKVEKSHTSELHICRHHRCGKLGKGHIAIWIPLHSSTFLKVVNVQRELLLREYWNATRSKRA